MSPLDEFETRSSEAMDVAIATLEDERQLRARVLALSGTSADNTAARRALAAAARATDLALARLTRALRGDGPVCL